MIEHTPWVGREYERGIEGQRIAVVGHSHHMTPPEDDRLSATTECILKVISGEYDNIQFFKIIRGYFGDQSAHDFWHRVMFFNFIPNSIGPSENRFAFGKPEQLEAGRQRVLTLIGEHRLDKMMVFSTKAWNEFPHTREKELSGLNTPLAPEMPKFTWGTYPYSGGLTTAVGLRHTMGAEGDLMKQAVRQALDLRSA